MFKCIRLLTLSCCYEKKVDYKIQLTLESDSSKGWTLHTEVGEKIKLKRTHSLGSYFRGRLQEIFASAELC